MSKTKNNVHPGHYKVAGRGRQGEDVIHDRQKATLAASQAMQEHQAPYVEHVTASGQEHTPDRETLARAHREEALRKPKTRALKGRRTVARKPSPKTSRAVMKALKPAATRSAPARKAARARRKPRS